MLVRIGGRGSKLSIIQMELVYKLIKSRFPDIKAEFIKIRTSGDIEKDKPLYRIKSRGLFEKEINRALIKGDIDIAVHSAKDVVFDTLRFDGLYFCVPLRGSRADAFISSSGVGIKDVPKGSLIGTSSLRRISYLKYLRKDVRVASIRGNIDTRIRKLLEGEYDGLLVGEVALNRLGIDVGYERLPLEYFVPAAGQGALIVLVRRGSDYEEIVKEINSRRFFVEVVVEKMIVNLAGGGCSLPLGVTCIYHPESSYMRILASIVDKEFRSRRFLTKSYRFVFEDGAGFGGLIGIARDFYESFLQDGGGSILEGWLDGGSS